MTHRQAQEQVEYSLFRPLSIFLCSLLFFFISPTAARLSAPKPPLKMMKLVDNGQSTKSKTSTKSGESKKRKAGADEEVATTTTTTKKSTLTMRKNVILLLLRSFFQFHFEFPVCTGTQLVALDKKSAKSTMPAPKSANELLSSLDQIKESVDGGNNKKRKLSQRL
jgi:hypothetical protein